MVVSESAGLFVGAVALGAIHGVEPGHGWPVAASYALDRANKWVYGLAASLLIGIGHLISSIAMVAAFFYAKSYFELTQVNQPVTIDVGVTTVAIGGPVSIVAGILLIALGWREYRHGHSHGHNHGDGHAHEHEDGHVHEHEDDHGHEHHHDHGSEHSHDHDEEPGVLDRITAWLPLVGGSGHDHGGDVATSDRGMLGIAWFAFVLGFAHEEEFEIIALCAGSVYCLELMLVYALTVIAGIVGLTLLLIAGYEHYEERVERYTPYLPLFSAAVLGIMGVGFIVGVF